MSTHEHCTQPFIHALSAGLERLGVLNSPFIVLAMTASNRGACNRLMQQQLIDVLSCALKPALRQSSFSTPGVTHAHQDMCSDSFGSSVVPHFTMSLPVLYSFFHRPGNTSHSHCCSFDTSISCLDHFITELQHHMCLLLEHRASVLNQKHIDRCCRQVRTSWET